MKHSYLITLIALTVMACGKSESPKLTGEQPQYASAQQTAAVTRDVSRPQLDILFVIDNSDSMVPKQDVLAANLDQFVNEFAKDNAIDFHIGVVSIFDSHRYGTVVKDFIPNGQLQQLKDATHQVIPNRLPYLDNSPGFTDILKSTLKMGVIPLKVDGIDKGPEFEELWSPVVAALSDPMASGPNKGFYRPDAALAVVFVSDADDQSDITLSEMTEFLTGLKSSPDKLAVYGVLIPTSLSKAQLSACENFLIHNPNKSPRDPDGAPYKVEALLKKVGGHELNLCDQNGFGKQLAAAGREVRRKALNQVQAIHLEQTPQWSKWNSIHVFSGNTEIAGGPGGWQFNPQRNVILVNPENPIVMKNNGQISIQYTPVHPDGTGPLQPHTVGTY
jgi:hypothetical protein